MTFAIVYTNTLAATGLQHLIQSYFGVSSHCFASCEEFAHSHIEQYDAYLVDAHTLVACMEQLLPRRQRVILITHDDKYQWGGMTLNTHLPVEDIIETIDRCIKSVKYSNEISDEQEALTSRETEVLRCVAQGYINKEIADLLHISVNTVLSHRKNIIAKLGIKTVSGLSLYAMMNGIIEAK